MRICVRVENCCSSISVMRVDAAKNCFSRVNPRVPVELIRVINAALQIRYMDAENIVVGGSFLNSDKWTVSKA